MASGSFRFWSSLFGFSAEAFCLASFRASSLAFLSAAFFSASVMGLEVSWLSAVAVCLAVSPAGGLLSWELCAAAFSDSKPNAARVATERVQRFIRHSYCLPLYLYLCGRNAPMY